MRHLVVAGSIHRGWNIRIISDMNLFSSGNVNQSHYFVWELHNGTVADGGRFRNA